MEKNRLIEFVKFRGVVFFVQSQQDKKRSIHFPLKSFFLVNIGSLESF